MIDDTHATTFEVISDTVEIHLPQAGDPLDISGEIEIRIIPSGVTCLDTIQDDLIDWLKDDRRGSVQVTDWDTHVDMTDLIAVATPLDIEIDEDFGLDV